MMKCTKNQIHSLFLIVALFVAMLLPSLAASANIERVDQRFGCTTAESITLGDVVMMKSDGLCYKADADAATLRPAIGIAGFTAGSGAALEVVTRGQVGGLSSLTKGADVYLSATAGGTTQTMPTAYAQSVGKAISATQYVIDIGRARFPKSISIQLPDPGAADADIAAGYVVWKPSAAVTITKAYLIPQAAWVAAAPANDATVILTNAAVGNIATLAVQTALAVGSVNDMGAITNAAVAADANVTIAVTANGTANAPSNVVQIEFIETGE